MSLENFKRYRTEQELMLSVLHTYGMKEARDHLGAPAQQSRPGPTSWLGLQRKTVSRGSCNPPDHNRAFYSLDKPFADRDFLAIFACIRLIGLNNAPAESPLALINLHNSLYNNLWFACIDLRLF
jgi:hypothetical protein